MNNPEKKRLENIAHMYGYKYKSVSEDAYLVDPLTLKPGDGVIALTASTKEPICTGQVSDVKDYSETHSAVDVIIFDGREDKSYSSKGYVFRKL